MREAETPYLIRPYLPQDLPFISNSWGTSYYKGANYSRFMDPKAFHGFHRPRREAFFQRPNATIIVVAAKEDQDLIMGYMALEKTQDQHQHLVLHYIYVKEAFKGLKLSSQLLKSITPTHNQILFTHLTEKAQRIMSKKPHNFDQFHFTPHIF